MVIDRAVVIICTHNPEFSKFERVLLAIFSNQSKFRVVVVDNASTNNVVEELQKKFNFQIEREPNLGNSFARFKALTLCRKNELLIFVDDDNYLDPTYIQNALSIASRSLTWGVFGGAQVKSSTLQVPKRFSSALPFVGVRNLGPTEFSELASLRWNRAEPIGAGMCIRPEVIKKAISSIKNDDRELNYFSLGRKGRKLLSGEDSFIARQATYLDLKWGYSPKLVLEHDINRKRLSYWYLIRLLIGYGRTDIYLDLILRNSRDYPLPVSFIGAFESFMGSWLLRKNGFIFPFFHFGQYFEVRRQLK